MSIFVNLFFLLWVTLPWVFLRPASIYIRYEKKKIVLIIKHFFVFRFSLKKQKKKENKIQKKRKLDFHYLRFIHLCEVHLQGGILVWLFSRVVRFFVDSYYEDGPLSVRVLLWLNLPDLLFYLYLKWMIERQHQNI